MVGMQQFNLRWNNYTSNILQVFLDHLSSGFLVDVTLSCQGRFIKAHKIILSACSPYFQEVFANNTDKHPVIILKGVKYEDLQSMIKFMYNGEIKVQEAQLDDLLAAAEMLQVKGLSNVRSKYERGEITSLNPPLKPVPVKNPDSGAPKKELPLHAIKAAVALFAPTTTTTRAPNIIATDLALDTHVPGARAQSTSTAMTRIPASTFRTANIANPAAVGVPIVSAIATLMPGNTIIPIPQVNNTIRSTVTTAITTLSLTTTTAATVTVSAISASPTLGGSLISNTCTTPSLDTPIITCVTGNFVDPNNSEPVGNDSVISATDSVPIAGQLRSPLINNTSGASSSGATVTEKKPADDAQPPRVRKRRKTSHVVNELAKETVFASNGTVLLEPDDVASKNRMRTSKSPTTPCTVGSDTSAEVEEITVNKMRVKIQTKNPQESLLIKEKAKNPTRIPRPPNAFMIFANEWRRKLAIEYPKENNKNISVRLGIMWKALTIRAKETYYKLAKKADEEHKQKYPGYYYSPQEARLRKTMKHDLMITKCSPASTKSSSKSQNSNELQLTKTFLNGDEREIIEFTDSSEYDDDDDDGYEDYEAEEEHDDDVIVDECSENEGNPHENSYRNCKRKGNASSSNAVNSSKT